MIHPAFSDQEFYDIIVGLFRAVRILAGESNDAQRRRNEMAVRALKAEAMLYNTQIERDFWQAQVRRQIANKARHRQKKRAEVLTVWEDQGKARQQAKSERREALMKKMGQKG